MSKKVSTHKASLHQARKVKNDEFYTLRVTVEDEISSILEHYPSYFEGKTVFLPCDNQKSEFYRLFSERFEELGLEKLVATSFALGGESRGLKIERVKGESESTFTMLQGDGDFRSEEVATLLEEADFVITNPPFSLMKEFFPWVAKSGKEFSILGTLNSACYSTIFPLFMDGKFFISPSIKANRTIFKIPKEAEHKNYQKTLEDGSRTSEVDNTFFLTSLLRPPIELPIKTAKENIETFPHKKLRDGGYKKYDNYDFIEVPFTKALPSDFGGVMAVPVTILRFLPHPKLEVLGQNKGHSWPSNLLGDYEMPLLEGKEKFLRIFVRWKKDENMFAS